MDFDLFSAALAHIKLFRFMFIICRPPSLDVGASVSLCIETSCLGGLNVRGDAGGLPPVLFSI